MNKKTYLIIASFIFILLCPILATATDPISYWKFNNDWTDEYTGYTLSNSGASFSATYPTYNDTGDGSTHSAIFATNDQATSTGANLEGMSGSITYGGWVKTSGQSVDFATMIARGTWTNNGFYSLAYETTANKYPRMEVYQFTPNNCAASTDVQDGSWHHVMSVIDDTVKRMMVYVDGSAEGNCTYTGSLSAHASVGISVGSRNSDRYYDGQLDEVYAFDVALSKAEVQNLYNCGDHTGCGPAPSTPFQITATDSQTGTSLQNFTAYMNSTLYTTTNGTIVTLSNHEVATTLDIELGSSQEGGYFNFSSYATDLSSDLSVTLHQTEISITAFEYLTGNELQGTFKNQSGDVLSFPLKWKAGNYNFSFNNASYFNKTQEFNVPNLFNGTLNITGVSSAIINITAQNAYSSQYLENFTGWAYNIDADYNASFNATGNYTEIPAIFGNYTIYVEKEGYALDTSSNYKNVTVNSSKENITFSLWSSNSIRINIYDENTNALTSGTNISIVVTGNSTENTYTTTDGTYFLDNLTDGEYTLKFSGGNYTLKTYAITVADRSTQTLNAYLSSEYQTVIFTITDLSTQATLEGASFTVARLINSTYTTTESKNSDITGRVQVSYLPNVKYRFSIAKTGYINKVFYLDPVIFSSYTVGMTPSQNTTSEYDYSSVSIVHYPIQFYNNEQHNHTLIFSSPNGTFTYYGFNFTYPGGSYQDNGSLANGEQFEALFNITTTSFLGTVNLTYWYDTTLTSPKTFTFTYYVYGSGNESNQTISHFKLDETLNNMGIFEKLLIAILIVLAIAGPTYLLLGPDGAVIIGCIAWGVISFTALIPLWAILPSLLVGFVYGVGVNR